MRILGRVEDAYGKTVTVFERDDRPGIQISGDRLSDLAPSAVRRFAQTILDRLSQENE